MKKIIVLLISVLMLAACSSSDEGSSIKVYTRDSASGTREAFESVIGLENLTNNAAETTSNGDMAGQVGKSVDAIGYVSLTTDFDANNIKPLKYEGVMPSVDTVNDGSYLLSRPFSYVTRAKGNFESDRKEQLVAALLDYMNNSTEGKQIILANGGITDVSKGKAWKDLSANHPILLEDNSDLVLKTGGSTSVEKTLTEVVTSFIPLAGNFKYEPNHTGSSDGFKRTLGSEKDGANSVDIGFASREFKDDEVVSDAMDNGAYCLDAVVVVVNKENTAIDNASKDDLNQYFSGSKTAW